jgi:hypothetical protein
MENDGIAPRSRPVLRLVWLLLVAFVIIVAVVQVHINNVRRGDAQQYQSAFQKMRAADRALTARLRTDLDRWIKRHRTYPPIERIGEITGPGLRPTPQGGEGLVFVDSMTGAQVSLWVTDGQWTSVLDTFPTRSPSRPEHSRWLAIFTDLRRAAYIGAYCWWGLMFLFFFMMRSGRERRSMARLMFGIAVASTFLACLGPNYWMAWDEFFDEDAPGLGWVSILLSVACLFAARRKHRPDPTPRCIDCGYNLTGNTSGVCPECGRAVPPPAAVTEPAVRPAGLFADGPLIH